MLSIRRIEMNELNDIKQLLIDNQLEVEQIQENISNIMVAYDDGQVIAAAGYDNFERLGIIKFVCVKKNRRGEYVGDGIVKALLNLADSRGINKIVVATDKCTTFFKKVGFNEISMEERNFVKQFIHKKNLGEGTIMSTDLPDFFMRACRSNKEFK